MATEDDAQRRRDALLAMYSHPQAGDQVKQQQQVAQRDLSQMRPQVRNTVDEQAAKASQVVGATAQIFGDMIRRSNDPALKTAVKNSSLNSMLEMV